MRGTSGSARECPRVTRVYGRDKGMTAVFLRSPLTDSNRRPPPYHGGALPTELRGQRRHSTRSPTRLAPASPIWESWAGHRRIGRPAHPACAPNRLTPGASAHLEGARRAGVRQAGHVASGASTRGESGASDGFVDFRGYRTWYRVFGELGAGAVPSLALHGGPGSTHNYFAPLARLAPERPVVLYDQIG